MHRLTSSVVALVIVSCMSGNAQTRWVHINHNRAGHIIIKPVDLNTATKAGLMRLPGIDERTAQRIIDGRPYQTRDELLRRTIVSEETFGKIKGRVTASKD